VLRWLVLALVVSTAQAAPRVVPFLPTPGIRLPATAQSGTFCAASQRAIIRTHKNTLVSIDASRSVLEVATLPVGLLPGRMICDAKDRIYIAASKTLVMVDAGRVTTGKLTNDVRDLEVLADGTLLVLDGLGNVSRWNGTTSTTVWSMGRPVSDLASLDASGDKTVTTVAGRIEVTTKAGAKLIGPNALIATWLDDDSVVFSDRSGVVARWAIDAPATEWHEVDHVEDFSRFVRTELHRAGKRFIIERSDGVLRTISIDARGIASAAPITRMPIGRRVIAAGDAPFAIVAVGDRAFVVDLTRPMAIDPTLPSGIVDSMAFSPDGRELAMFAGQDIVVAAVDRSAFRRLVPPTRIRGLLTWAGDGTLFLMNNLIQTRFNPDGTAEQRKIRAIGFTSSGNPVTVTRDQRLVIDRIHSEQSFQIPTGISPLKVDVTDRLVAIRSARRIDLYALDAPADAPPIRRTREANFMRDGALVGDTGILFVDDTNSLFLADDTGEHALGKLQGFPMFAVSPDRKRVALAMQEAVSVYDAHGKLVDGFTSGVGPIRALAWSPNLHTLAVAGRDGVELWSLPR
jgi:WD40 repeat protein